MNEVKEQFSNVSKKYDSQREHLIPCYKDFYTAGLPLVKSLTHAKTVLDIGAGTGLFSQFIYEQNPGLYFTLTDISAEMLNVARERFGNADNFEYLELDFSKDALPGKYDIIITGLAVHYLDDVAKAKFYKNIFLALNDGGLFINADRVAGKNVLFDSLYNYYWRETISQSGIDREALIQAFERIKLEKLTPLETQLKMLEKAGFNEVDCIYKNKNFAVIGGFKDETVETAVI
ncbi:MAG: class I SAM-dependent methyltransferase [Mucilaginibacter sp.]